MKASIAVLILSLLGVLPAGICAGQTAEVHSLRCGTLLDGKSDTPRKNVVLSIQGDHIREVGGTASGDVIDLSRETCLPGMIDTHTHVLLQGDITAADYDVQLLKQSPDYREAGARLRLHHDPGPGNGGCRVRGCGREEGDQ